MPTNWSDRLRGVTKTFQTHKYSFLLHTLIAICAAGVGAAAVFLVANYSHIEFMGLFNQTVLWVENCNDTIPADVFGKIYYSGAATDSKNFTCIQDDVMDRFRELVGLTNVFCLLSFTVFLTAQRMFWELGKLTLNGSLVCFIYSLAYITMFKYVGVAKCFNAGIYNTRYYGFLQADAIAFEWYFDRHSDTANGPCFPWAYAMQAVIIMMPLTYGVLCVVMSSVTTQDLFDQLAAVCLYSVVSFTYGWSMPDAYIENADNDGMLMFFRIVVHTIAVELISVPFRSLLRRWLPVHPEHSVLSVFVSERFASLYSRLLFNCVTDATMQAVSAILLAFVEVSTRLTVHDRDRISAKFVAKLSGKGAKAFNAEQVRVYRSVMTVLQSTCEITDILVMTTFFTAVLLPDGPLKDQANQKVARDTLRELGFKVEDVLFRSAGIQLATEIATDLFLVIAEEQLGHGTAVAILNLKTNKAFTVLFTLSYLAFGFIFPYYFLSVLFLYPSKKLDRPAGGAVVLDLEGTWINFMPSKVEVTYVREWLKTQ